MMDTMSLNGQGVTLVRGTSSNPLSLDDSMEMIGQAYDPMGLNDRLYFNKQNKIYELTELKP